MFAPAGPPRRRRLAARPAPSAGACRRPAGNCGTTTVGTPHPRPVPSYPSVVTPGPASAQFLQIARDMPCGQSHTGSHSGHRARQPSRRSSSAAFSRPITLRYSPRLARHAGTAVMAASQMRDGQQVRHTEKSDLCRLLQENACGFVPQVRSFISCRRATSTGHGSPRPRWRPPAGRPESRCIGTEGGCSGVSRGCSEAQLGAVRRKRRLPLSPARRAWSRFARSSSRLN
jgi:hypothetical protein